jgi:hypothetical protein
VEGEEAVTLLSDCVSVAEMIGLRWSRGSRESCCLIAQQFRFALIESLNSYEAEWCCVQSPTSPDELHFRCMYLIVYCILNILPPAT